MMKKPLCIFLLWVMIILVSCTSVSSTTMTSVSTSTDTTSTTETEYVHPFPEWTFMKQVNISSSVLDLIQASTGRIAYLDEHVYMGYQIQMTSPLIVFHSNGETKTFPTTTVNREAFVLHYDSVNDVIYYIADGMIRTIPAEVDSSTRWYPLQSTKIQYVNPYFSVLGNRIMTIQGDVLFQGTGVLVYPHNRFRPTERFYTYESKDTVMNGCTILTFNGFDASPTSTKVHDVYTCDKAFTASSNNVLIPLMRASSLKGFVTITSQGSTQVFTFEDDLVDYASLEHTTSYRILSAKTIYFEYRDRENQLHRVMMNWDFSIVYLDRFFASNATASIYFDEQYLFYEETDNEYHLYKNDELFYTYTSITPSWNRVSFSYLGNIGLITDLDIDTGLGRMIRVDLTTGEDTLFNFENLTALGMIGNFIVIQSTGPLRLYDVINDQFVETTVSGTLYPITDSILLLYTDMKLYFYDLNNGQVVEMNRVGHYEEERRLFAFLAEYQGYYYIIS